MSLTFNIEQVEWEKVPNDNRVSIKTLHWRITKTATVGEETYVAAYYEATSPDQERLFTNEQIASITKPTVIQWVRNKIGPDREAEILARLDADLDKQINPTTGSFVPVEGA